MPARPKRAPEPPAAPSQPPSSRGRPKRTTPRAVVSLDLGRLAPAVTAAAQAAGTSRSTWLRTAIQHQLAGDAPAVTRDAPTPASAHAYRLSLDAELTAALDRLVAASARRSRAAVLRALILGADLGLARPGYAPDASHTGVSLTPDAIRELAQSNYALVAVGRLLNQVAKSLHLYPGQTTTSDRLTIDRTVSQLRDHLEHAAPIVDALRPQIASTDGTRRRRRGERPAEAPPSIQTRVKPSGATTR